MRVVPFIWLLVIMSKSEAEQMDLQDICPLESRGSVSTESQILWNLRAHFRVQVPVHIPKYTRD
jgi:hypothetical protein